MKRVEIRLSGEEIEVYLCPLPKRVKGLVRRDQGGYIVLVNSSLPEEEQKMAIGHEVAHIIKGHIEGSGMSREEEEGEAEEEALKVFSLISGHFRGIFGGLS